MQWGLQRHSGRIARGGDPPRAEVTTRVSLSETKVGGPANRDGAGRAASHLRVEINAVSQRSTENALRLRIRQGTTDPERRRTLDWTIQTKSISWSLSPSP